MARVQYEQARDLSEPYATVLGRVREALAAEGFGVMAEIDVRQTLKEKLGIEGRPYVILGACNPKLAHAALDAEPDLGVLLPCNVVVYENDAGTRVATVNAPAMLGMVGNAQLEPIADEVQTRLRRVLESL
jgi:uncharacterized protein (DUF302 family)